MYYLMYIFSSVTEYKNQSIEKYIFICIANINCIYICNTRERRKQFRVSTRLHRESPCMCACNIFVLGVVGIMQNQLRKLIYTRYIFDVAGSSWPSAAAV